MKNQNKVGRSHEGRRRDETNTLQVPKIFRLSGAGPQSPDLSKLDLETIFFCRRMQHLPTPRKSTGVSH